REPKTGCREQFFVFAFSALAPARHDEHVEIDEFAETRFVTLGNYGFHNQYHSAVGHGPMAVFENRHTLLVSPVVNNPFQYVGITARGHRMKEISRHQLAAIQKASLEDRLGTGNHLRRIEKNTS